METNEITDDETQYFKFEDEFKDSLDCFALPYTEKDNVLDWAISFNPPVEESEHIIDDGTGAGTKIVTTAGGVLIAKVSFQMLSDEFDISGFSLQEDTNSPTTGIKINLNITNAFENQSTFRFKDATASKNADLSNLIVSSGTVDDVDPSKSTYKEYTLTPNFDKDTLSYQMELLEYLDEIDIKPVLSDSKSTIKIKVPKRDADGNLVYESDGITIVYEEKEIQDNVASSVKLNKLGEPDTNITVIVTAEDKKTVKSYNLVIKRPYGIIKGSIYTSPTYKKGIYKSDIRVYNSADVASKIDISMITPADKKNIHSTLLSLKSQNYKSNDDGTYEIYIIPGKYDILLDKSGYLDHIYTSKEVKKGDTIDLGYKELIPGDIDKNASIGIEDLSEIINNYGIDNTSANYDIKYDFNEDLSVGIEEMSFVISNYSKEIEIT